MNYLIAAEAFQDYACHFQILGGPGGTGCDSGILSSDRSWIGWDISTGQLDSKANIESKNHENGALGKLHAQNTQIESFF